MPENVIGGNIPQQDVGLENPIQVEHHQQRNIPDAAVGMPAVPTIIDHNAPVVVFVGPPSSGKSMILVRLAKYLRSQGYTIETDPTFLNTPEYHAGCRAFLEKLDGDVALEGTVKFLLVNVYDRTGRIIAKLLEAPGEDFYTTDAGMIRAGKNDNVEAYLATIMTSTNPKSYVVLLDLDSDSGISFRNDNYHRNSYMQRFLRHFLPAINLRRDRIVLLYNKIDMTMFGTIHGCHNARGARQDAEIYYGQLFARLRGGLFNIEQFAFKAFCTGMFSRQVNNWGEEEKIYHVADDCYPCDLWREITRKF